MSEKKKTVRRSSIPVTLIIAAIIIAILIIAAVIILRPSGYTPGREAIDITTIRNVKPAAGSINTSGSYYTYSDPSAHVASLAAIDVSAHQREIDWSNVKANHIDAAYIRLGLRGYESGAISEDEYFEKNVTEAYDAGISVGVYFFSQAVSESEAMEEAQFVLSTLEKYPIDLHVVYDFERIETESSRTRSAVTIDANANALAFCGMIAEAGYTPMIYTNAYTARTDYDLSLVGSYPIWYANYNEIPDSISGYSMWQYTESGALADGTMQPVDLDLIFVEAEDE